MTNSQITNHHWSEKVKNVIILKAKWQCQHEESQGIFWFVHRANTPIWNSYFKRLIIKTFKANSAFTMIIAIKMVFIKSIYCELQGTNSQNRLVPHQFIWTFIFALSAKKVRMQFLVLLSYLFFGLFPFFLSIFLLVVRWRLFSSLLYYGIAKSG
jgi:hypothetical protein